MPPVVTTPSLRLWSAVAVVAVTGAVCQPLGAQEVRPLRFEGARGAFVVIDAPAAGLAASDSAFEDVMWRCGRAHGVEGSEVQRLTLLPTLDVPRGPGTETAEYVSFLTMPRPLNPGDCFTRFGQDYIAPLRGVRYSLDSLAPTVLHPYGIALIREGTVLQGQLVATAPSWQVTPRRVVREPVGLVRTSIPLDSLAPIETGFATELGLAVFYGFDSGAVVAPLPEDLLLELWTRALPARLARATATPAVGSAPPLPLDRPRNQRLRDARSLASDGQDAASARLALAALDSRWRLSKKDRQLGYLHVGDLALRHADTSAARTAFAQAQRVGCVFLPEDTPQGLADVALPILREDDTCGPRPLPVAALLGALRPGFGAPRGLRRPYFGALLSAAIVVSGLNTVQTLADARARYDAYETLSPTGVDSATADAMVEAAYRDAEGTRERAVTAARVTAALWSIGVIDGVLEELWRRRQLRRWLPDAAASPGDSEASRLSLSLGARHVGLRWEFR